MHWILRTLSQFGGKNGKHFSKPILELKRDVPNLPGILYNDQGIKRFGYMLFGMLSVHASSSSSSSDRSRNDNKNQTYNYVVIGGTFDRIHEGHEILLTEARKRCNKKLTIGVTDQNMTKSKVLPELVLPLDVRMKELRNHLESKDPHLEYKIVPISDPFGPSITDPELEAIVGSRETERGCMKVNEKRLEKSLNELDIILVDLKEDECVEDPEVEEHKVSSSSQRIRLLGTLLKPPLKCFSKDEPYVIGLTGGSASGKSSVAKRFEKLGAGLVDCDKLGHFAYEKGTKCHEQVVQEFGLEILDSNGSIDRRKLGAIVFSSPENRHKLEQLVWPEIQRQTEEEIRKLWNSGKKVILLDAAVLLQAGWDRELCNEIWSCVLDRKEAVNRIMKRDGKSMSEAGQRLDSQLSNPEVVSRSNVVFCTFWREDFSQKQVEKAWKLLAERMK